MKFVEWLVFANHDFYPQKENGKNVFWGYSDEKLITLEEVYQYWLDNYAEK
jgi:hypothetical protein